MLTTWTRRFRSGDGGRDAYGRVVPVTDTETVRGRRWGGGRAGRQRPSAKSRHDAEAAVFGASGMEAEDVLTDDVGDEWEVVEAIWVAGPGGLSHWQVGLRRVRGEA